MLRSGSFMGGGGWGGVPKNEVLGFLIIRRLAF